MPTVRDSKWEHEQGWPIMLSPGGRREQLRLPDGSPVPLHRRSRRRTSMYLWRGEPLSVLRAAATRSGRERVARQHGAGQRPSGAANGRTYAVARGRAIPGLLAHRRLRQDACTLTRSERGSRRRGFMKSRWIIAGAAALALGLLTLPLLQGRARNGCGRLHPEAGMRMLARRRDRRATARAPRSSISS